MLPDETLPNYYSTLGVGRNASEKEIIAAYRREVRLCHPDANPGRDVGEERIRQVNQAYEVLGDRDRRARYDWELERVAARRRQADWDWFVWPAQMRAWQASPVDDLLAVLEALLGMGEVVWERVLRWELEPMAHGPGRRRAHPPW